MPNLETWGPDHWVALGTLLGSIVTALGLLGLVLKSMFQAIRNYRQRPLESGGSAGIIVHARARNIIRQHPAFPIAYLPVLFTFAGMTILLITFMWIPDNDTFSKERAVLQFAYFPLASFLLIYYLRIRKTTRKYSITARRHYSQIALGTYVMCLSAMLVSFSIRWLFIDGDVTKDGVSSYLDFNLAFYAGACYLYISMIRTYVYLMRAKMNDTLEAETGAMIVAFHRRSYLTSDASADHTCNEAPPEGEQ